MPATVSTDDKPRRARKKPESRRWVREVQGIAALVVAGFGVVALASFYPRVVPGNQESLAGPVGLWLSWALFRGFGYAGFLFPMFLGAWGASAFLRPSGVRGRLPWLGLAVLLLTATGLLSLAASSDVVEHGGLVGRGLTYGLRAALGTAELRGLFAGTSGNISLVNQGTITLSDENGVESAHSAGNLTLSAIGSTSELSASVRTGASAGLTLL